MIIRHKSKRYARRRRIRARIIGNVERPRFSVFRSNRHIGVQLIDDKKGETLVALHDREVSGKKREKQVTTAEKVGEAIAKKALEKGVTKVVFDRGGYAYHGIVRAVAEGARKGGLKF